jgi:outer membrane protein assembly factor BamB
MRWSLLLLPLLLAADWPGWRGPNRDGISTEAGLLKAWPRGGPKLLWSVDGLGGGYSTPSVADGKLYVLGDHKGEEYVHALKVPGGKKLWSVKIGKIGENRDCPPYPGPRSTPTINDGLVYALGSDGDLVCLKVDDGKVVWRHHLEKDFKGNRSEWAYAESPLIDGERLICTPGGPIAAVMCLNKKTGKVIWKTPMEVPNQASFSSPVIGYAGKRKTYVVWMGPALVGFDAATGKQLWRYRKNTGGVNAMTPIVHDGHVFSSAAGDETAGGDALLKFAPTKDGVDVKQVYLKDGMKNFHGGAVRIGESLYGTGKSGLVCLDWKTGKVRWKNRSVGSGSIIAAGGCLYVRNGQGVVALVEVNEKEHKELGRLRQPKRSKLNAFAQPVVANGVLYLRDGDLLFAYDVAEKK